MVGHVKRVQDIETGSDVDQNNKQNKLKNHLAFQQLNYDFDFLSHRPFMHNLNFLFEIKQASQQHDQRKEASNIESELDVEGLDQSSPAEIANQPSQSSEAEINRHLVAFFSFYWVLVHLLCLHDQDVLTDYVLQQLGDSDHPQQREKLPLAQFKHSNDEIAHHFC